MKLLVAGVERSGTTWVATALSRGSDRVYVHEPDNPDAGRGAALGAPDARYQVLAPGDPAPEYAAVWEVAFAGGWPGVPSARRVAGAIGRIPAPVKRPLMRAMAAGVSRLRPAPPHVIVKSVYCPFTIEWIWDIHHPTVLVVVRNPLNILASFMALHTPDDAVDRRLAVADDRRVREGLIERYDLGVAPAAGIGRLSWWIGLACTAYQAAAERHPDWLVVSHVEACLHPSTWFEDVAARVGLPWSIEAEQFLVDANRPGSGYAPERVTADAPTHWQRVLSADQEREARAILARFPLRVPA
jgi:hypothetical protein